MSKEIVRDSHRTALLTRATALVDGPLRHHRRSNDCDVRPGGLRELYGRNRLGDCSGRDRKEESPDRRVASCPENTRS